MSMVVGHSLLDGRDHLNHSSHLLDGIDPLHPGHEGNGCRKAMHPFVIRLLTQGWSCLTSMVRVDLRPFFGWSSFSQW